MLLGKCVYVCVFVHYVRVENFFPVVTIFFQLKSATINQEVKGELVNSASHTQSSETGFVLAKLTQVG